MFSVCVNPFKIFYEKYNAKDTYKFVGFSFIIFKFYTDLRIKIQEESAYPEKTAIILTYYCSFLMQRIGT